MSAATKTKRAAKTVAWMPDEVIVDLYGERGGKLLESLGWTTVVGPDNVKWPADRIEAYLWRIKREWVVDFGKGWKLEVR